MPRDLVDTVRQPRMTGLLRIGLILVVLLICGTLVAVHGVRGLALIVAVAVAASIPRTRVWRVIEQFLVRLTGSRRRAAIVVLAFVIGSLIAYNVYELLLR